MCSGLDSRKHLAYQQYGGECDFVVTQKGQVTAAIQASVDLSDAATKKREVRGLVQCCRKFGLSRGVILSLDTAEQFESEAIQIDIVPAWLFFSQ